MTEVNYNGKEELLMADYEGISDSDLTSKYANTDFDITDAPSTYITNTQMTYALTCKRLFPAGDTYICNDEGTYKKGHTYTIKVDGETKTWEDITTSGGEKLYQHDIIIENSNSSQRVAFTLFSNSLTSYTKNTLPVWTNNKSATGYYRGTDGQYAVVTEINRASGNTGLYIIKYSFENGTLVSSKSYPKYITISTLYDTVTEL